MARKSQDRGEEWSAYEIRTGKDGKAGIYLRAFNVRLAVFNGNTHALQLRLAKLFAEAPLRTKPAPKKRIVGHSHVVTRGDFGLPPLGNWNGKK